MTCRNWKDEGQQEKRIKNIVIVRVHVYHTRGKGHYKRFGSRVRLERGRGHTAYASSATDPVMVPKFGVYVGVKLNTKNSN